MEDLRSISSRDKVVHQLMWASLCLGASGSNHASGEAGHKAGLTCVTCMCLWGWEGAKGKSKCRQSRNSEDIFSGSLLIMAHSQRSQHQSGLSKTPEAGRIASWKCLGLWLLKRNWRFLMCTGTFLSEAHGVASFSKDSNSHSIPDTSTSWPSALHSDLPTWGILQERSRAANLSIVNQAHQTSVFTGGFKYCQVFKHSHLVPLPGILV